MTTVVSNLTDLRCDITAASSLHHLQLLVVGTVLGSNRLGLRVGIRLKNQLSFKMDLQSNLITDMTSHQVTTTVWTSSVPVL